MYINVKGLSSLTTKKLTVSESDKSTTLMSFLQENSVPIASSCRGEAVCQSCIVNNNVLSCTITVADFLDKYGNDVLIDYI
jgi:Na+-transporting NADH:ubiquinone oxidoreductase subunit NqrF